MNIKTTITKMEFVFVVETKLQVIKTSGRLAVQGTNTDSHGWLGAGKGQEIPVLPVPALCSLRARRCRPRPQGKQRKPKLVF